MDRRRGGRSLSSDPDALLPPTVDDLGEDLAEAPKSSDGSSNQSSSMCRDEKPCLVARSSRCQRVPKTTDSGISERLDRMDTERPRVRDGDLPLDLREREDLSMMPSPSSKLQLSRLPIQVLNDGAREWMSCRQDVGGKAGLTCDGWLWQSAVRSALRRRCS